jgi:sec-independent protein translocase protein TatB
VGDLSPIKILVVLVVALVVLGPEKLPDMARKAGKTWNDLRRFRDQMHTEVREVIGDVPGLDQVHRLPGIRSTMAASLLAPSPRPAAPAGAAPAAAPLGGAGSPAPGTASAPSSAGGTGAGRPPVGPRSEGEGGGSVGPPRRRLAPPGPAEGSVLGPDDPGLN